MLISLALVPVTFSIVRSICHYKKVTHFGTHTVCSLQTLTSSAVRPASRMSRLTRDTLPMELRQDALKLMDIIITVISKKWGKQQWRANLGEVTLEYTFLVPSSP